MKRFKDFRLKFISANKGSEKIIIILGSTHCTELTYLFGKSIVLSFKFNENDKNMMDFMSKLWTNFAKYG